MPEPDSLRDYTLSSSLVSGVGRADVQPAGGTTCGGLAAYRPANREENQQIFDLASRQRRDDAGRCWQYRAERATVQWGGIVFQLICLRIFS